MIGNYLKIAFRNFLRFKTYTIITIFGLATGIATFSMIMMWVTHEMSFDKFHENKDRIFQIVQKGIFQQGEVSGNHYIPYALPNIMQEEFPEIESKFQIRNFQEILIAKDAKKIYESMSYVESTVFSILSIPLKSGAQENVFPDLHSVAISESFAQKMFTDENPIGKTLLLNSDEEYTVSAVFEDFPTNSSISFHVAIPFENIPQSKRESWSWDSHAYILLKENVDIEHFKDKIKNVIRNHLPENKYDVVLRSITKLHLYDALENPRNLNSVVIFTIVAIIVLLIACINYANLTSALATTRLKEVSVRKVLGASKKSLFAQFYTESVLLAFISLFFAFFLIEILLPMFNNIIHLQFDLFQIPGYFYLLLFLLTILIGFISGSYPAILTSSFEPYKVLAGFARLSLNHGFRTFLVILQYSVSIALIIITVVIYKQIDYIHSKELGFETSHVVCLQANQLLINKYDIFKQELSKSNLILGVTNGSTKPSSIGNVNPISWEGKPDDERVLCFFHLCDTNFLDFFNMEFVKGRNFSDSNVDSTSNSYIVNETAVRMMNLLEPIGKRFSMYGQDGYIIGVVKDFHFQPLHVPIQPLLFTNKQNWINWVFVRIDGESIPEALHFIENTYHSIVPEFPFKYSFLDDDFEVMYRNFTEMKEIIKYFAILAIIISSLGLFGLILFITRQQQKEVAIRKIHGASVYQIILHFSKKFVVWLSLANLFSYIIAYYFINRILEMFAYHAVISLIIYILPGFFILVFALIIINLQTLKVANVNPSIVLKYE